MRSDPWNLTALALAAAGALLLAAPAGAQKEAPADAATNQKLRGVAPGHAAPVHPNLIVNPVVPEYRPIDVRLSTNQYTYRLGEAVRVQVSVSESAYVYVYSTDGAGTTRQLFPNFYDRDNLLRLGQTLALPGPGYNIVTSESGWDTIHVIAIAPSQEWKRPREFDRATSRDPFPLIPGGVERARTMLRDGLEAPLAVEGDGAIGEPHPRLGGGDDLSGRIDGPAGGNGKLRNEPQLRISPQPPGRPHRGGGYGEAYTRIYVKPENARPIPAPYYPWRPPVHDPGYGYLPPGHGFLPGNPRPPQHEDWELGTLLISSSPIGSDVYVDGNYYGRTPVEVTLPEGFYEVQINRNGYRPFSQRTYVSENRTRRVQVRLSQLPPGARH